MSTFKETLKNQKIYLEDEKLTRLKKIQNQNKSDMIAIAQWNASQAELYPNSLSLNQAPSLNEVLISQYKNDTNDMTNRDTAINYLSKITSDVPTAEYIVERITSIEVLSLIQQFEKFKRELKKYYPKGLSKDEFVQYIKLKQNDYLNPENTNLQPLTEEEINATTINEIDDEIFQYTTPIKKKRLTPFSTKMKKAKVEKPISKDIVDYFQQLNPIYEKQPEKAEPYSYDNPDELLISDNQDAKSFAEELINRIKPLTIKEIKSLVKQYKIPNININ